MFLKKLFLFAFLLLLFWPASAQTLDFIPKNNFTVTVDQTSTSSSMDYSVKHHRISHLETELRDNGFDPQSAEGDLSYSTETRNLSLTFGLSDKINLKLRLPIIKRTRSLSLTRTPQNDATLDAFLAGRDSAQSEGMGDFELKGIWRLTYSDQNDFRFLFTYRGDNGLFPVDETSRLRLGSGTRDFALGLKWTYYFIESRFQGSFDYEETYSLKTKKTDQQAAELETFRGKQKKGIAAIQSNFGLFHYGLGYRWEAKDATLVNQISQLDQTLFYALELFGGIGNLSRLEDSSVVLPWELEIGVAKVIRGIHAKEDSGLTVKANLFF
ncbi:MAG: hypothetical protein OEY59_06860 [Deltaproteobacteria bacterium]|nr:hypothetical protein [Deltaproteobacteria bacterium]